MVTQFKKISDALKFFSFEQNYFLNRFPQKWILVKPEVIFVLSAVVMEINHSNRTGVYEFARQHSRPEWMAIFYLPTCQWMLKLVRRLTNRIVW